MALTRHLHVGPSLSVGAYSPGAGQDLGTPLVFRTGLEVAYRFESGVRLGLAAHHRSNASLARSNSGSESVSLVMSVPSGGRSTGHGGGADRTPPPRR